MRLILLLALTIAAAAPAAEPEAVTLDDGRVLVGVYDQSAGTVTIVDHGGKATTIIKVKPGQVAARAPAPVAAVEAAPSSATEAVLAGQPDAPGAIPGDPRDQLRAIAERADRDRLALALAWLQAIDLTPPPEVVLGADPRESEKQAKARSDEMRGRLAVVAGMLRDYQANPERALCQKQIIGLIERQDFVDWYLKQRRAQDHPEHPAHPAHPIHPEHPAQAADR